MKLEKGSASDGVVHGVRLGQSKTLDAASWATSD